MSITSMLQQQETALRLIHQSLRMNFNATVGGSFYHGSGIINADNFNVTARSNFNNYEPIYG